MKKLHQYNNQRQKSACQNSTDAYLILHIRGYKSREIGLISKWSTVH
jgi:hypothetical protein